MQLKDWFYNGYSRDELEKIYHNFRLTHNLTNDINTSGWGRCTLARELEIVAPLSAYNFTKKIH